MLRISPAAQKSDTENSRLQAGPWMCRVKSSVITASEQRGHWLNLDLFSHSVRRCSVRLAISTTCKHNAELYTKSSSLMTEVVIEQLGRYSSCKCHKNTLESVSTCLHSSQRLSIGWWLTWQ